MKDPKGMKLTENYQKINVNQSNTHTHKHTQMKRKIAHTKIIYINNYFKIKNNKIKFSFTNAKR